MTWTRAGVRAAIALVGSVILFLIVPDSLLAYLTVHIVPFWRDVLMIAYGIASFGVAWWVFVRLQRVPS